MADFNLPLEGQNDLLTVKEMAALLRTSPATVYRIVERRSIPFLRLPRGIRFSRKDVEAYLKRCSVESVET
jgi:excisionase family DNA binding protein